MKWVSLYCAYFVFGFTIFEPLQQLPWWAEGVMWVAIYFALRPLYLGGPR
jgi:hypothetical protein